MGYGLMTQELDVTVITPTIPGREGLLEECKESVQNQTMRPKDHLVAVDADRLGPAAIRNSLVEMVETEWVTFLDDDDLLMPNHFATHSWYMDMPVDKPVTCSATIDVGMVEYAPSGVGTKYDVIGTWAMIVHEGGSEVLFDVAPHVDRIMSNHNTLPMTATVRTSKFREVGGFKEDVRFEDMVLWQDLLEAGASFRSIYIPTWYYRLQPNGRNAVE